MIDHLRSIGGGAELPHLAGQYIAQSWSSLYWLNQLIYKTKPINIIELGTGLGSLSVFFAINRPDHVFTYDIVDHRTENIKDLHKKLGVTFYKVDCLSKDKTKHLIDTQGPKLVFCDNGNKQEEFKLYSPLLRSKDIIVVHDCGTEFNSEIAEIHQIVKTHNLTRWRKEELEKDNTLLAVWIKE